MSDVAPDVQSVLDALEELLAWPEIARSPQLARFLDYIVRRTIAGDAQSIKAYSIAVDVLGRPADFDPQADPIVRVQARRLRSLLEDYYRGPGQHSRVHITLPTGRYVPEFSTCPGQALVDLNAKDGDEDDTAPASVRSGGRRLVPAALGLLAMLAGVAIIIYILSQPGLADRLSTIRDDGLAPPRVTVTDFQHLGGDVAEATLSSALAIELVTDLRQFGTIDAHYQPADAPQIANDDGLVLTGIVRPDGDLVQYSAILTDSRSADVVWNLTIPVASSEGPSPTVLDTVSRRLSMTLGSPRGPLHAEARRLLDSGDGHRESPYMCRVLFDIYRETAAAPDAARASECFEALPAAERGKPMALAALASLTAERAAFESLLPTEEAELLRVAGEMLQRALQLDATNAFVWQQRALWRQRTGDLDGALTDFKAALQLNPAEADALAATARALAFAGRLAEAEPIASGALRLTPRPPAWYFGAPALIELRRAADALALHFGEAYVPSDRELGPIIAILAGAAVGNSSVVNRYLPQVLELPTFRAEGVLPRLRKRVADETLLEQVRSGLSAAGVSDSALEGPF